MAIPSSIQEFIDRLSADAPAKYDDLRAVVFNGTLKRSPEPSNTEGLLSIPLGIFESVGVNYVSCSPFRVPVARLAAAQAALTSAAERDK